MVAFPLIMWTCGPFQCLSERLTYLWENQYLSSSPSLRGFTVCEDTVQFSILSTLHFSISLYYSGSITPDEIMQWLFGFTLCVLAAQLCPTFCNPMDYSLPGSSVHGILQVRILEWIAISFSRGSSWPRDQTLVSCIAGRFFPVSCNKHTPMIQQLLQSQHGRVEWSWSL